MKMNNIEKLINEFEKIIEIEKLANRYSCKQFFEMYDSNYAREVKQRVAKEIKEGRIKINKNADLEKINNFVSRYYPNNIEENNKYVSTIETTNYKDNSNVSTIQPSYKGGSENVSTIERINEKENNLVSTIETTYKEKSENVSTIERTNKMENEFINILGITYDLNYIKQNARIINPYCVKHSDVRHIKNCLRNESVEEFAAESSFPIKLIEMVFEGKFDKFFVSKKHKKHDNAIYHTIEKNGQQKIVSGKQRPSYIKRGWKNVSTIEN
jgi:hypothetical protein